MANIPKIPVVKCESEILCPHCSLPIIVGMQLQGPIVDWAIRKDSIREIKEDFIKRLDDISDMDPDRKAELVMWLQEESTVVGPDDVEKMIKQIRIDIDEAKNDKTE